MTPAPSPEWGIPLLRMGIEGEKRASRVFSRKEPSSSGAARNGTLRRDRAASGLARSRTIRRHHERWDSTGYPAQLASTAIPRAAVEIILDSAGQFDPALRNIFQRCAPRREEVSRMWPS
jgi:hypothetical protein